MSLRKFGNYDLHGRTSYAVNPVAMVCKHAMCPVGKAGKCWHRKMAARLAMNPSISDEKRAAYAGGAPVLDLEKIVDAAQASDQSTIALQFMGDLMSPDLPMDFLPSALSAVALCIPRHTVLMLTREPYYYRTRLAKRPPSANLWLGGSASFSGDMERVCDELRRMREHGWHTWLSLEPLLGEVTAEHVVHCTRGAVEWIALGPETGPGARACHPAWLEAAAAGAKMAGIPVYDKRDLWHGQRVCLGRRAPWAAETLER